VKAIYDLFKFQRLPIGKNIINLIRKRRRKCAVVYRFDYYKTVVPIQFAYAKSRGADVAEDNQLLK
jgi:hypothetical protein